MNSISAAWPSLEHWILENNCNYLATVYCALSRDVTEGFLLKKCSFCQIRPACRILYGFSYNFMKSENFERGSCVLLAYEPQGNTRVSGIFSATFVCFLCVIV